jgi:hypothetical protein
MKRIALYILAGAALATALTAGFIHNPQDSPWPCAPCPPVTGK